jgi:hypothetical protein
MLRSTHPLILAVLCSLPFAAEARFGKHDDSKEEKKDKDKKDDDKEHRGFGRGRHHRSDRDGDHDHDGSPRRVVVYNDPCDGPYRDARCWRYGGWPTYFYEPAYAGAVEVSPWDRLRFELTGELLPTVTQEAMSLAGQLRLEGMHWGIALEGRHIAASLNGVVDHLGFFNAFMSYSLYSAERGRVRLEGGVVSAFAPDLIVLSPALGMSLGMALSDHWGIEALARASIRPHVHVEVSAGVSYAIGPVGIRAGYRHLYLNDNGLVDGVPHDDSFGGPYVGVGFAF